MGLEQEVGGLVAGNTVRDDWRWKAEDKDVFSVKAVKNLLQKNRKGEKDFVFKWVSWVLIKCNVLAWRAEMGRLPVKKELVKRNIHVESLVCPFCDWAEESAEHILTGCAVSMEVWYAVGRWCRLSPIFTFGLKELLELYKDITGGRWVKNIIHGIIIVSCWRGTRRFFKVRRLREDLFLEISKSCFFR
ncbi:putative reverse transcriptase zinc-binding domain-containing protein [Helianthus annuus]|nr:putative reverse transcriptase zinc-binding domain-containing protein [Helianthus annuus]